MSLSFDEMDQESKNSLLYNVIDSIGNASLENGAVYWVGVVAVDDWGNQNLDNVLEEVDSDKSQIISATVMLNDIEDKPMMDKVWAKWIGDNPSHWPERSCFGVKLHAGNCIEIRVVAVRKFSAE